MGCVHGLPFLVYLHRNQQTKIRVMSQFAIDIVIQQEATISDMAKIIGRYKGATEVFAAEVREIMKHEGLSPYTRLRLEWLAGNMDNCVYHNERLWDERGQREAQEVA